MAAMGCELLNQMFEPSGAVAGETQSILMLRRVSRQHVGAGVGRGPSHRLFIRP